MAQGSDTTKAGAGRFDDESSFVEALRRGDDAAYEHLVMTHGGRMLAVIRRIERNEDDAQDSLQDAFTQVFRAIKSFNGDSKLSTWLHRVAVNAALMKRRARGRRPEKSIEDLLPKFSEDGHRDNVGPAWELTPDAVLQQRELREHVRHMIDELPGDYRDVLLLRDIEEMDTAAAAQMLHITPGAVKTRLHRARQALRELLDRHLRQESPA